MEAKLYDTVIIGGGPGGYTAALYTARAGLSTVVIEKLSPGGQMATTDQVDNYPGFPEGVNGFELAMKMQESAQRFGAETHYGEAVELELASSPKRIVTDSEEFLAKTVILSTGASPRELGLAGERELRGKGVSYCATCDGMFYKDKTVAIVGGGNTAAADALYLPKSAKKSIWFTAGIPFGPAGSIWSLSRAGKTSSLCGIRSLRRCITKKPSPA